MPDPIETYRGAVASWECDPNGHMNVRYYVAKFDDATWHFSERAGIGRDYLAATRCGLMAVDQHLVYKRELMPPDGLHVTTEVIDVSERKMRFRHTMFHTVSGEVAATCELLGIHVDLDKRRSVPMPQATLARLRALAQGGGE